MVKTDNDLRAVKGKGTYSVLGFSRCNNLIGKKLLPTKQITEKSVDAKEHYITQIKKLLIKYEVNITSSYQKWIWKTI